MGRRVPILRQRDLLIASIQEVLSDSDIIDLQSRILSEVTKVRAKSVIIDVSALDVLDSFGTRMLSEISASVHLRGAKTVIVGIQPEVAMSMVLLGLDLNNVSTALDLDQGLLLVGAA